jgi:hypothetical protein
MCIGTLLFVAVGQATATSGAHFFSATGVVNDNASLTVTWDEAGVGQQTVNYTLTGTAAATFACINGGGNHPKAANKETVNSAVSAGASFTPQNGRVSGSINAPSPSAGSFTCPSGQTLVLAKVTYRGLVLTDTTNKVTANIGTASRTFLNV